MVAKKKKVIPFIAAFAVTLFFLLERKFLPGLPSDSASPKDLKLVEKVISLIRNHYFEEPQPFETMEGAFRGLANSLDPVSCYLDSESFQKYKLQKEASLKETGLILYKEKYGYYPQSCFLPNLIPKRSISALYRTFTSMMFFSQGISCTLPSPNRRRSESPSLTSKLW